MANQVQADGGGLRYNAGKVDFSLTPPEWEEALAKILTVGSIKYARNNWLRGMPWSTMVGCARRHLRSFLAGERNDPETNCHHLAHAAWNLLALMSYDVRELGTNDLIETTQEMLAAVGGPPGPALQAIIDQRLAEFTKPAAPVSAPVLTPKALPTIAELEAILAAQPSEDLKAESDNAAKKDLDFLVNVMSRPPYHSGCNNSAGCVYGLSRPECFHADHGRGDPGDGPIDPDCPCRATAFQRECADIGCGFCTAAQHIAEVLAVPHQDEDLPF